MNGQYVLYRNPGWRPALIIFLVFLTPLTPLLAAIHEGGMPGGRPLSRPLRENSWSTSTGFHRSGLLPGATGSFASVHLSRHILWLLLSAENGPMPNPCDEGRADGREEADGALWFVLGMFFYGVPIAYAVHPSPDDRMLAARPAAERGTYADCYGDGARSVHVKWAWLGLAFVCVLSVIVGLILLSRANFNLN